MSIAPVGATRAQGAHLRELRRNLRSRGTSRAGGRDTRLHVVRYGVAGVCSTRGFSTVCMPGLRWHRRSSGRVLPRRARTCVLPFVYRNRRGLVSALANRAMRHGAVGRRHRDKLTTRSEPVAAAPHRATRKSCCLGAG